MINGLIKYISVIMDVPFTVRGSVVEIFADITVWQGIRKTVEQINANALLG